MSSKDTIAAWTGEGTAIGRSFIQEEVADLRDYHPDTKNKFEVTMTIDDSDPNVLRLYAGKENWNPKSAALMSSLKFTLENSVGNYYLKARGEGLDEQVIDGFELVSWDIREQLSVPEVDVLVGRLHWRNLETGSLAYTEWYWVDK